MKFVESLNNKDDADGPLTLEQVLEEIETKARINQGNHIKGSIGETRKGPNSPPIQRGMD